MKQYNLEGGTVSLGCEEVNPRGWNSESYGVEQRILDGKQLILKDGTVNLKRWNRESWMSNSES